MAQNCDDENRSVLSDDRDGMRKGPDAIRKVLGLTLNVGAPDFDDALKQVLAAREQLQAIVDASASQPALSR